MCVRVSHSLCVCVCMYVCVYVCVCDCVCHCVCMCVCATVCMCVYVLATACVCISVCVYLCVCVSHCVCVCVCVCVAWSVGKGNNPKGPYPLDPSLLVPPTSCELQVISVKYTPPLLHPTHCLCETHPFSNPARSRLAP